MQLLLLIPLLPTTLVAATGRTLEQVSGAAASGTALVHEREQLEDRSRSQFEHWCNATLPAQEGRRSALQRLLNQAQVSTADGLPQLKQEKAALGDSLERLRVATEASQSSQHEQLAAAMLDQEDAAADSRAMQRAVARFAKDKNGANQLKVLRQLEAEAQSLQKRSSKQVQMLQTGASSSAQQHEVSRLESEYNSKTTKIEQVQHLYETSIRSLAILTEAIEDESAYLADVQSVCQVDAMVYKRMKATAIPALRGALADLAKETAAAAADGSDQTDDPPSLAAALTSLPAVPPPPQVPQEATKTPVAAAKVAAAPTAPVPPAAPVAAAPPPPKIGRAHV